jgi:hypothetical protein
VRYVTDDGTDVKAELIRMAPSLPLTVHDLAEAAVG